MSVKPVIPVHAYYGDGDFMGVMIPIRDYTELESKLRIAREALEYCQEANQTGLNSIKWECSKALKAIEENS